MKLCPSGKIFDAGASRICQPQKQKLKRPENQIDNPEQRILFPNHKKEQNAGEPCRDGKPRNNPVSKRIDRAWYVKHAQQQQQPRRKSWPYRFANRININQPQNSVGNETAR